ncbi:MAG: rRNA pseudouridine synthase [Lachnospiraceae bacterium]|nr:rRNA pseudouridine synthase [Lachnospiraceae bacterium]
MRLDKFLSDMSSLTRSQIKEAVKKGRVSVNGNVVKDSSLKVSTTTDVVNLDKEEIKYNLFTYIIVNKPSGLVTSTSDDDGPNVMSILKGIPTKDLFPVGRLDKDTEGLLLITNDGELGHRLLSPKHHVPKTYYVECAKPLGDMELLMLKDGVDIGDDKKTLPSKVKQVEDKTILLTIEEGRFHQVKRMLKAVNNSVLYLKRISFGNLSLDEQKLPKGSFKILDEDEIKELKRF